MNSSQLLIYFTIALILSCSLSEKANNSINGHWHLYRSAIDLQKNQFYKLNIENDTIAFLEGTNIIDFEKEGEERFKLKRNILNSESRILLWIDGTYEEFDFQLNGDSLMLESENELKYIGIRKNKNFCDLEIDHFSTQMVGVKLENNPNCDTLTTSNVNAQELNIYYGKNKYTNQIEIEINGQIRKIKNIPIEIEKFKSTIPNDYLDNLVVVFYIDEEINTELLKKDMQEIDLSTFKELCQAFKYNEKIYLCKLNTIEDI